jgi:hypothetical protein
MTTVVLVLSVQVLGQKSPDGLWEALPEGANLQPFALEPSVARPQRFRLFRLDTQSLAERLRRVRPSLDSDAPRVSFPLPDASFVTFRVQETQTMAPALAELNPDLKTYRGESLEDPGVTVRFERNKEAISAILLTRDGRFYISPVQQEGATRYMAYARTPRSPQDADAGHVCLLDEERAGPGRARLERFAAVRRGDPVVPGSRLHTYRLAIGTTGEYAAYHGGTAREALAAIVATINRVNEVYEKDVAVRFELVAGQMKLIKTDPATDGYTNDDPIRLADENQAATDGAIGKGAYDVGHVFSTGRGGYAPGFACVDGEKARGATGRSSPQGEQFSIDYVSHELGHQLGANHTFNTLTGDCRSRHGASAYEPGSGSTIMAYAGICGSENIEGASHPYFHAASLDEISPYVHSGFGSTCGAARGTSNHAPVVKVTPASAVIPRSTPFELSGSATDRDGDRLSFTWEQMDTGYSAPPNDDADGMIRPLFRSIAPSPVARRTFPAVEHLPGVQPVLGHTLPAIARTMRFRLTARDGRAGGGSFAHADARVSVAAVGPFRVTAPAAGAQWAAGSTQQVHWDVAGTDNPPLGIASVRITLSTDGGRTYAHELLRSTANNGTAGISVPALATSRARVKVEAVGGVFFNVSPSDFTIQR